MEKKKRGRKLMRETTSEGGGSVVEEENDGRARDRNVLHCFGIHIPLRFYIDPN